MLSGDRQKDHPTPALMVKVPKNLGNVYNGAAAGLRRESNANGLEAIDFTNVIPQPWRQRQ